MAKHVQRKDFYQDEIGEMNAEFFNMKAIIDNQQNILEEKLSELAIAKKEIELIHKYTRESMCDLLDSEKLSYP